MRSHILAISLVRRQIQFGNHTLALSRKFFELYSYLALNRLKDPAPDDGYVESEQIVRLPAWRKNSLLSVGKQIRRHIRETKGTHRLIEAAQKIKGPFRLGVVAEKIGLDVPAERLESFLDTESGITSLVEGQQKEFYRFVEQIWRADNALTEGRLKAAINHYRRATEVSVLPHHGVMALCSWARALERQGAYAEALEVNNKALGLLRNAKEDHDWSEANICLMAGWIHWRERKWTEAERLYRKALALVGNKRDHQLLGEIYNGLGLLCREREQYSEALQFYQRALEACVVARDYYGIQAAYFNIGQIYSVFGDRLWRTGQHTLAKKQYGWALDWTRQCNTLATRLAIADDLSDDQILLSHLYRRLGRVERALQAATTANQMALQAGNKRCIALSFRQIAQAHIARRDAKQAMIAIEACKKAVGPEFWPFLQEDDLLEGLQRTTSSSPNGRR